MRDDLWEEFVKSWGEPIPKMAIARTAWDHAETAKRPEIVAAAKGYWAWLKAHPKPPSAQSAQSFVRDAVGWSQWLRYAPDGSGASSITSSYPIASVEAKALATLYEIVGKTDFFRDVKCRGGTLYHANPITPRLLALAAASPRAQWARLDRHQAAAWDGMVSENVQFTRQRLQEGASAPWPWPPRKDGTLSPVADGPEMTNEDLDALASEGQK